MSISYDLDKIPDLDQALIAEASAAGMQVVHVICDEKDAKGDDAVGVSFFVIVQAMPRIGERLELQDGKVCVIRDVIWRLVKRRKTGSSLLIPNVVAIWTEGQGYANV